MADAWGSEWMKDMFTHVTENFKAKLMVEAFLVLRTADYYPYMTVENDFVRCNAY